MASRRPPLFELLQQEDRSRQGRPGATGRSGVLSGKTDKPAEEPGAQPGAQPEAQPEGKPETQPAADASGNGRAAGAVERKPEKAGRATPLDGIASPTVAPGRTKRQEKAEPKPSTERAGARPRAKPVPEPERPAGAADWSGMHPQSAVRIRMMWVYGAIVAILAAVVGVWTLGYNLGESSKEAELKPYLDRASQPGPITDPMTAEAGGDTTEPPPLSGIERQDEQRQAETPPRTNPTPPVIEPEPAPSPAIDVLADVREKGNNYLKLASGMDLERARGLAQHLTDSGVHAMALREGQRGYGLYTALAVPSERFSAMEGQRREHAERVVRLLERAPRDMGGPYDARGHLWIRFDG